MGNCVAGLHSPHADQLRLSPRTTTHSEPWKTAPRVERFANLADCASEGSRCAVGKSSARLVRLGSVGLGLPASLQSRQRVLCLSEIGLDP
jgi:hypothetical protein